MIPRKVGMSVNHLKPNIPFYGEKAGLSHQTSMKGHPFLGLSFCICYIKDSTELLLQAAIPGLKFLNSTKQQKQKYLRYLYTTVYTTAFISNLLFTPILAFKGSRHT